MVFPLRSNLKYFFFFFFLRSEILENFYQFEGDANFAACGLIMQITVTDGA